MQQQEWDWPPRRRYRTLETEEVGRRPKSKNMTDWYLREMQAKRPLLYKINISLLMFAIFFAFMLAVAVLTTFAYFLFMAWRQIK